MRSPPRQRHDTHPNTPHPLKADPTRDNESFAGHLFTPAKKIGSLIVAGGALMDGSTQQVVDESSAGTRRVMMVGS
jgi:hypothetical protein